MNDDCVNVKSGRLNQCLASLSLFIFIDFFKGGGKTSLRWREQLYNVDSGTRVSPEEGTDDVTARSSGLSGLTQHSETRNVCI